MIVGEIFRNELASFLRDSLGVFFKQSYFLSLEATIPSGSTALQRQIGPLALTPTNPRSAARLLGVLTAANSRYKFR